MTLAVDSPRNKRPVNTEDSAATRQKGTQSNRAYVSGRPVPLPSRGQGLRQLALRPQFAQRV